jgi:hypothetical protein
MCGALLGGTMKTLALGQKVILRSGTHTWEGTVIGLSEYRVEVELVPEDGPRCAIHFTRNGKPGTIFEKIRQCGFFYYGDNCGWCEYDRRPLCTEFGPWELVEQGAEMTNEQSPHFDILCATVDRKIHNLSCDCDDCWKYRALVTRRRDGETMEHYKKDFEGLTEQECFDLLQKWDEDPMNKPYGEATYSSWRAALRTISRSGPSSSPPQQDKQRK